MARVTGHWEKSLGTWIFLGKWFGSMKSRLSWSLSIQHGWIIFVVMLYKLTNIYICFHWCHFSPTYATYSHALDNSHNNYLSIQNYNHLSCNLYMKELLLIRNNNPIHVTCNAFCVYELHSKFYNLEFLSLYCALSCLDNFFSIKNLELKLICTFQFFEKTKWVVYRKV